MVTLIDNTQDIIDSRDVLTRIAELESDLEDDPTDEEAQAELETLKALEDEASGSPDWQYGETLIRGSYFKDYAQQLADDLGLIDDNARWPATCIDWDQAARELKHDYYAVSFGDERYYIRA